MITGSCICESCSYELTGSLQNARACHCSKCRKVFSGASSAYAELAPGSSFRWNSGTDALARFSTDGEWAVGFCGKCGSTLCGLWNDDVHGLTLGCVDGDPGVRIEMHLFVGSKAPWDCIGGNAPQFEENSDSNRILAQIPK